MTTHYEIAVIGSGQAGGPLATTMAKAGRSTVIIERADVGGTCVNVGCTPTKTMIASARVAYLARRGADYGVHTGPVQIDLARVRERKRAIVEQFRSGSERSIAQAEGLELLRGEARFVDAQTIEVALHNGETCQISADLFLINTGARPATLSIPGIETVATLDSSSIMELDTVPEHLIVLGGGYIGLEFGQMFRRFGSQVTIVQRGAQLLAREDHDIAEAVAAIMREDGITVLLEAEVLSATMAGEAIELTVRTTTGEQTLRGSHLLNAAGRTPNSDKLNLTAAGVRTLKGGFIEVNDRLVTSNPRIYALGDVKGGPAFTHISYDDFRILRANLLEGGDRTTRERLVPYTVFIDPQLGRVGLTEHEARAQGRSIKVATMAAKAVARAREVDETRGLWKAIIDADSGQILGGAILGLEGGEVISVLQTAMMGRLHYAELRDAVFAHPTLAESLNNLFTNVE
jgi:pyruvate/2-oxoglutarate dehydrogenase complex dihydrolipoamide dehydrogenase (E3) component